jgi:hypothetical protein
LPPGIGPTPLENGPTTATLPTIPEMDYGLPGAPPRVAPPEDAIYRTQSGAEYPAGWSSKAPEVAPQDAYGRGQFTEQARAQFPEQTRIAEDALKDWRRSTSGQAYRARATARRSCPFSMLTTKPGSASISKRRASIPPR